MFHLSLKMLFGDRAKFIMLLMGVVFASFLMTQQSSVFWGLMSWTTSHLRNIHAKIWVVEHKVEQANELKPLRDTDVSRVRSVEGVAWAVPMYAGILQARLSDGNFKPVMCIGLDSATLVGAPSAIREGLLEDIRLPNCVMIDQEAEKKLKVDGKKPLGVGDVFEINDREARVVGLCTTQKHFFGYPYIFTTYDQALQFAPKQRKMLSCVLAEPALGWTAEESARAIEAATGLKAYTEPEFEKSTLIWYFKNTGIPFSFGTVVILGFLVGTAVVGQTFYTFVLENLKHLGALKAMGASDWLLTRMILLQALTVGLLGYGIGVGLAAVFGLGTLKKGEPPFNMRWEFPVGVAVLVTLICLLAGLLGVLKVRRVEPAIVFRG